MSDSDKIITLRKRLIDAGFDIKGDAPSLKEVLVSFSLHVRI